MTQSNSIAGALRAAFGVQPWLCGAATAGLALLVMLGGVGRIAAVSSALVPAMAMCYLAAAGAVIVGNLDRLPGTILTMLRCAVSPRAAAGGTAGAAVSMLDAVRWGTARGVFSNEAGLGSAAITAASAATDSPPRQGYICMTGVFFDTLLICTATGLAICCSGVLGTVDSAGQAVDGAALTILAFQSVLGPFGAVFVGAAIVLFAFSTILGWEFQGETALEYLLDARSLPWYRAVFVLAVWWGALVRAEAVFYLADICNALMCLPNLLCLLCLSGTVVRETLAFQRVIQQSRRKGHG
jgi:AGCS family alanine or glycine:cation symporter